MNQYEYLNQHGNQDVFGLPGSSERSVVAFIEEYSSSIFFSSSKTPQSIRDNGGKVIASRVVVSVYSPDIGDIVEPIIDGLSNGFHRIEAIGKEKICIKSVGENASGELHLIDKKVHLKFVSDVKYLFK